MSEAVRFLHALAQVLATMGLYSPGHPATVRARDNAWAALQSLLEVESDPVFLFLAGAPVYGGRALHELAEWPWTERLSSAGVQRWEIHVGVSEADFAEFLEQLRVRSGEGRDRDEGGDYSVIGAMRFGTVAVAEEQEASEAAAASEGELAEAGGSLEMAIDLDDEIEIMKYILAESRQGRIARAEVEALARVLATTVTPAALVQVGGTADRIDYPAVHAVNTALLTMTVCQSVGVEAKARHRIGIAALLHDIGMTRLPEQFAAGTALAPEDRGLMESHTVLGAGILLESGRGMDLAATVSMEHHIRPDGTGYPSRRFAFPSHWASRIIGVASAYVALRSPRPYRGGWSVSRVLEHLEEGMGTIFEADAVKAVVSVVRV
jgi:putative nucleotidyltransferase with HDIG domain